MKICSCKNYGETGNEHEGVFHCPDCGYPYSERRQRNQRAWREEDAAWEREQQRMYARFGEWMRGAPAPVWVRVGERDINIAAIAYHLADLSGRDRADIQEALRQCHVLHGILQKDPPPEVLADAAMYKHWEGVTWAVGNFWDAIDLYGRQCGWSVQRGP